MSERSVFSRQSGCPITGSSPLAIVPFSAPYYWEDNRMKLTSRGLASASLIAMCAFTSVAARADDGSDPPNHYVVTSLTSDLPGPPNTDAVLQNAWGVAFTPAASPFWISDNATGVQRFTTDRGRSHRLCK